MWNEVRKTAVGVCLLPRRYSLWNSHDKDQRYWFLIHFVHPNWDFVQMAWNCLEGTGRMEYICIVITLEYSFQKDIILNG